MAVCALYQLGTIDTSYKFHLQHVNNDESKLKLSLHRFSQTAELTIISSMNFQIPNPWMLDSMRHSRTLYAVCENTTHVKDAEARLHALGIF